MNFLQKYEAELRELRTAIDNLEERLSAEKQDKDDVEEFIRRLKKVDVQELTRELCLELIEYVTVDEYSSESPRVINIYYKLIDKPLNDRKTLYSDKNA